MLVYDVTNQKSFDNINKWLNNIREVRFTMRDAWVCLCVLTCSSVSLHSFGHTVPPSILRMQCNCIQSLRPVLHYGNGTHSYCNDSFFLTSGSCALVCHEHVPWRTPRVDFV